MSQNPQLDAPLPTVPSGSAAPPAPGMVQCEITGQWVPEDEVITIQGHRVCAEGKLELLERLRSGQGLPGELEQSTILRRLGAMVLDWVIVWGASMAIKLAVVSAASLASAGPLGTQAVTAAVDVFGAGLGFAYYALLHAHGGRTVGKMAAGIKVVRSDGTPINLNISLYRTLIYDGPDVLAKCILLIVAAVVVATMAPQSNTPFLPGMVAVVVTSGLLIGATWIYFFVSTILALVDNERQRAVHDRVAGTRVIMVT